MNIKTAYFRFYEELNDFLPTSKRKKQFAYTFTHSQSIKEAIESLGVPHGEIDVILVNGESVDFNYSLKHQDLVSVYPVFESLDIRTLTHLRPKPLRHTKFILDVHLGRLAKYLRMCGFDSLFFTHIDDEDIVHIALRERRIILTKDRALLKNKNVTHGYWIRQIRPREQLAEVFQRLDLLDQVNFLSRCLLCNSPISTITKQEIRDKVPGKTMDYYEEFFWCELCKKLYWKGSHYHNMLEILQSIKI